MSTYNAVLDLPEWYVIERETEKIIEKLVTVKELDYYLNNPDEYIRRLAIIRLAKLKLKDSENKLREMLEDHAESNENKNLAAWALRSVYTKLKNEILVNNRYLARFTGTETLNDIIQATYEIQQPSINIDFSKNTEGIQMPSFKDELFRAGSPEFNSKFEYKSWLSAFSSNVLKNLKATLISAADKINKAMVFLLDALFVKIPKYLFNCFRRLRIRKTRSGVQKAVTTFENLNTTPIGPVRNSTGVYYMGKHREVYDNTPMDLLISKTRSKTTRESNFHPLANLRKAVFILLYVLLFPIRILLKYKIPLFCFAAAFYMFFNFTIPGKIIFKNYFGTDLQEIQNNSINTVKDKSIKLWDKFMTFTTLDKAFEGKDSTQKKTSENIDATNNILYTVTAPKGLNIRKSPDASSSKIDGGTLKYGSTVSFLGKVSKDSSGRNWYYIKTSDRRKGWVSAKYLKKKEG